MRWARPQGVVGYRLQLAENAEFEPLLIDQDDLDTAEKRVDLPPGQYFWRLASINASGHQGPVGPRLSLEQMLLPEGPEMADAEMQDGAFMLQWHASEPGLSWRVQLARDAEFADLIADELVTEPRYRLEAQGANVVHVRVQAIDADGVAGPFGVPQQIDMPADFSQWLLLILPALLLL